MRKIVNYMNSNYKNWNKPNLSENSRTKQGYYRVQNPKKYIGNPNIVVYRSSWEMKFCKFCDYSPSVKKWSSEPLKVRYVDRVSNLNECKKNGLDPNNPRNWKIRNYYTDFYIEIDRGDNNIIEKWFVEIKPSNQLKKPIPPAPNSPLKTIRRFNMRAKEYLINEAKFASLNTWANKNNMKFYIFTEETLSKILGRI